MNKLHASWELAEALKNLKTTILGGWWVVGGFNSVVILRLSQPQARDWAWAWAELGKMEEKGEDETYKNSLQNKTINQSEIQDHNTKSKVLLRYEKKFLALTHQR